MGVILARTFLSWAFRRDPHLVIGTSFGERRYGKTFWKERGAFMMKFRMSFSMFIFSLLRLPMKVEVPPRTPVLAAYLQGQDGWDL
jgi:hypothetical protein